MALRRRLRREGRLSSKVGSSKSAFVGSIGSNAGAHSTRRASATTVWALPGREPDFDAVSMLATFGQGPHEQGYVGWLLVGRTLLVAIGLYGLQPHGIKPSAVPGMPATMLWPSPPGVVIPG
jgi:hypothetical protein